MTRSSDTPGSYREWAADQKAADQAEKRAEQQRKARERDRLAKEAIARDQEAATGTAAVDRQVATLQGLQRASLSQDPRISLVSLRHHAEVPPLELGQLALPCPAPQWADFEPEPPGALRRVFGGQARYEAACEESRQTFAQAQTDHRRREAQRQRHIAEARRAHHQQVADAQRQ
jgi:restriction system protein